MIKILNYKNIYGISELFGADNLAQINVIYAPNGTAKSSIADSLEKISNNQVGDIKDVYGGDKTPVFEIEIDDNEKCTSEHFCKFNVLKYTSTENFGLENKDCSNLVISKKVSSAVSKFLDTIQDAKNAIQSLISSQLPKKKNSTIEKSLLSIAGVTSPDDKGFYISLIKNVDLEVGPLSFHVDEKMLETLLNDKMKAACQTNEVKTGALEYFEEVKKISSSEGRHSIFDDSFQLQNLIDFHGKAKSTGFYKECDPKRELLINGEAVDEKEIEKIINDEMRRVFDKPEAKEKFDKIKKGLGKQKKQIAVLETNPALIPELIDYKKFSSRLFVSTFQNVVSSLKIEKQKIVDAQKAIDDILRKKDSDDELIKDIWSRFESRFQFKKFDLKIENEYSAKIGTAVPVFAKYVHGTKTKITDPKEFRFSTGEIKTYNLINFILTIEELRYRNEKVTIILDDAVDSFDYRNKYGIIDYLCDIKDDKNIQLLILTHNFDFYRSSILAFGKRNCNQYFAYKDNQGVVTFYDVKNKGYYLELSNFNAWKNNPTACQLFALAPFMRNVLQLRYSRSNEKVQNIDLFLHYRPEIEKKTVHDLISSFDLEKELTIPKEIKENDLYLASLFTTTNSLLDKEDKIKETNLEAKITIGLFIRLFLERYLFLLIKKHGGSLPTDDNKYTFTHTLIKNAQPYLKPEEKRSVTSANLASPSYLHANSFMYEPLIDVGFNDLVESATWLLNVNEKQGFIKADCNL